MSIETQPVSTVEWVDRDLLSANDWNPNHQAPPEHKLLTVSILENGWTQPIVVRKHADGERLEIVDGYHRWLCSGKKELRALTDSKVPVVVLPQTDDATARMATVRHNRARGVHAVLPMADIVADLNSRGLDSKEIGRQLGMDDEEIDRLLDRGNMALRASRATFSKGWTV